jgi:hypothetical protein
MMPQAIDLLPAILPTGELLYTTPREATALNLSFLQQLIVPAFSRMLQKALRAFVNHVKAMPPATLLCAGLGAAALVAVAVEQRRRTR